MRSRIARAGAYSLGLLAMIGSIGANLAATSAQVPEIDAGSISAGLGLLTAGVLILRSRRRGK